MSRAAITYPDKNELREMTAAQLDAYIQELRLMLTARSGPAHKAISKRLEVAEKERMLKQDSETP